MDSPSRDSPSSNVPNLYTCRTISENFEPHGGGVFNMPKNSREIPKRGLSKDGKSPFVVFSSAINLKRNEYIGQR